MNSPGTRGARRQRDVEVVGVRVGGGDETFRQLEPGAAEILVHGRVALDQQVAVLLRVGERLGAEVEHDVGHAGHAKLLGHACGRRGRSRR